MMSRVAFQRCVQPKHACSSKMQHARSGLQINQAVHVPSGATPFPVSVDCIASVLDVMRLHKWYMNLQAPQVQDKMTKHCLPLAACMHQAQRRAPVAIIWPLLSCCVQTVLWRRLRVASLRMKGCDADVHWSWPELQCRFLLLAVVEVWSGAGRWEPGAQF